MTRRQYAGAAVETTTTGSVASSGAVTVALAASTGWPDGTTGPFAIVIDPGTPTEEKVLVTERIGLNLTVGAPGRGYDGTSAVGHASGAVVYLTYTAIDFDEANAHLNATSAAHAATAISYAGSSGLSASTVEAALDELDSEKAAASHTHSAANVTDFDEAARDAIGAAIVAGTGIDVTVNDGANTITIDVDPSEFTTGSVPYTALAVATRAEASGSQSFTSGVGAYLSPSSETDPDSFHSGGTFTVPADGVYLISLEVWHSSAVADVSVYCEVAGSGAFKTLATTVALNAFPRRWTIDHYMTAGQTIKGYLVQQSGSTSTIQFKMSVTRVAR